MLLTFPPMNNQAAIPTTTANSNVLATLISPSAITTTAIASASGMVSTRTCRVYFTHFLEGKERWNPKTHP